MNKDQMKALLIRDKEFLKSLYDSKSSPNAKNILKFASDSKLNTLLKFIHLVCTGEIKIRKDYFKVLEKKHLKVVEKYFESKAAIKRLLTEDRRRKLNTLIKFSEVFHELLFTLFNQIMLG